MRMECTVCGMYFRVRHGDKVKKPFRCISCRPPHGKDWAKDEVDRLKELRMKTTLSIPEIADILKMDFRRVEAKVKLLRLRKPRKSESFGERRTVNGIIEVKAGAVNLDRKGRKKRNMWIPLKDLAWFVHRGEIPQGFRVKIKDMKLPQDAPENFDLVMI